MGSRARLGVVLAEPPLGQRVRTPGSQQHAVTVLRGRAPTAQAPRPRSHGAQTVCTGLSGLNYMLVIKRALRSLTTIRTPRGSTLFLRVPPPSSIRRLAARSAPAIQSAS